MVLLLILCWMNVEVPLCLLKNEILPSACLITKSIHFILDFYFLWQYSSIFWQCRLIQSCPNFLLHQQILKSWCEIFADMADNWLVAQHEVINIYFFKIWSHVELENNSCLLKLVHSWFHLYCSIASILI